MGDVLLSGPAALIADAARRTPLAVELAAYASLTGRIEPELVRRLRLDFVRAAPASVEADLWLGPLVSARSADTIVLTPSLLPALRARVPRDRLADALAAIADVHRDAPPLVQLEDSLIADLLLGKPDEIIEGHLRAVLGSLAADPARRRSLIAWAWTAIPRLPLGDRQLPLAGALTVAAGLSMRAPTSLTIAGARGALAAVPSELFTGSVELEVRRHDRYLLLSHATADTPPHRRITVPDTTPRFVEVEAAGKVTLVAIPKGASADPLALDSAEIILRCLGGRAWTIASRNPAPAVAPTPEVVKIARLVVAADGTALAQERVETSDLILVAGAQPYFFAPGGAAVLTLPSQDVARFRVPSEGESVPPGPDALADAVLAMQGQPFADVVEAFSEAGAVFVPGNHDLPSADTLERAPLAIPGCFRASFFQNDRSIGVIGLNPWYLSPPFLGETVPDVDERLLPDDIDAWCARHDVTILLLGAAPERLRPTRRVHLDHAVIRPGRFDFVFGPRDEPRPRTAWRSRDHFEIPLHPGERHLVIHLADEGGKLTVEVQPRALESGEIIADPSHGPLGVDGSIHMQQPLRRDRLLPPLSRTAEEVIAYLGRAPNVLIWGPVDAAFDDLRDVLSQHLEHAGYSVLTHEVLATLPSVDAARVPNPICFESYEQHVPRTIPTFTFLSGIAPEDPDDLAAKLGARLVTATDWTAAEIAAHTSIHHDLPTLAALDEVAGVPALVLTTLEHAGSIPDETRDLYRTTDLEVLTAWRTLLDGGEPRIARRHLGSGLFRVLLGTPPHEQPSIRARSRWHERELDHTWLDAQFERAAGPSPAPSWIYLYGDAPLVDEIAAALGRDGGYGLVVEVGTLTGKRELVSSFVAALPPHLPRHQRIKIVGELRTPAHLAAAARLGATTLGDWSWSRDTFASEVHAILDAGPDEAPGLRTLATESNVPYWHPDRRDQVTAAHALSFLQRIRRSEPGNIAPSAEVGAKPKVLWIAADQATEVPDLRMSERFELVETSMSGLAASLREHRPAIVHVVGDSSHAASAHSIATVLRQMPERDASPLGTAFVIGDGILLTARHVVEAQNEFRIHFPDEAPMIASVLARSESPQRDWAVLDCPGARGRPRIRMSRRTFAPNSVWASMSGRLQIEGLIASAEPGERLRLQTNTVVPLVLSGLSGGPVIVDGVAIGLIVGEVAARDQLRSLTLLAEPFGEIASDTRAAPWVDLDASDDALVGALRAHPGVRLVVLDRCLTASLAVELTDVVDCATGTRSGHPGARTFAVGLYRGLADGLSVEEAYKSAIRDLQREGILGSPPTLHSHALDSSALVLVPSR